MKDSEGIGKGCKADNEVKLLYKRRSLHEGGKSMGGGTLDFKNSTLNFKDMARRYTASTNNVSLETEILGGAEQAMDHFVLTMLGRDVMQIF